MNTYTLYRTAIHCLEESQRVMEKRQAKRWSIGVQTDFYALQWQRYQRIFKKVNLRLEKKLNPQYSDTYPRCWKCGNYEGLNHRCCEHFEEYNNDNRIGSFQPDDYF